MSQLDEYTRNTLDDEDFGIPEKRMYPLIDAEHVRKAIQMFNHAPEKYKYSLARQIYRRANEYNIDISKDSDIIVYLPSNLQENFKEIYMLDEQYEEMFNVRLNEILNEVQASTAVDTAISYWNTRYKQVVNLSLKNALFNDLRAESNYLQGKIDVSNVGGILDRAKFTGSKLGQIKGTAIKQVKRAGQNKYVKGALVVAATAGVIAAGSNAKGFSSAVGRGASAAGKGMAKGVGKATVAGAKGIGAAAKGVGKVGLGTSAAIATGALAKKAVDVNSVNKDELLRNQANRYVQYVTKLMEKTKELNVSAVANKNASGNVQSN